MGSSSLALGSAPSFQLPPKKAEPSYAVRRREFFRDDDFSRAVHSLWAVEQLLEVFPPIPSDRPRRANPFDNVGWNDLRDGKHARQQRIVDAERSLRDILGMAQLDKSPCEKSFFNEGIVLPPRILLPLRYDMRDLVHSLNDGEDRPPEFPRRSGATMAEYYDVAPRDLLIGTDKNRLMLATLPDPVAEKNEFLLIVFDAILEGRRIH